MFTRKLLLAPLSVAALALTLSACTDVAEVSDKSVSGSNASVGPETETPAQTETPAADDPHEGGVSAFGKSVTYDDGLSMTVGKPAKFTPGEYAVADDAPTYVKFKVTLVNNTGSPFDPSMFTSSLQSGNDEMDEVFDSGNGFGGGPDTKILNGREAVFWIGYGAQSIDDLVLEVSPGFDYADMLFTNTQ